VDHCFNELILLTIFTIYYFYFYYHRAYYEGKFDANLLDRLRSELSPNLFYLCFKLLEGTRGLAEERTSAISIEEADSIGVCS